MGLMGCLELIPSLSLVQINFNLYITITIARRLITLMHCSLSDAWRPWKNTINTWYGQYNITSIHNKIRCAFLPHTVCHANSHFCFIFISSHTHQHHPCLCLFLPFITPYPSHRAPSESSGRHQQPDYPWHEAVIIVIRPKIKNPATIIRRYCVK